MKTKTSAPAASVLFGPDTPLFPVAISMALSWPPTALFPVRCLPPGQHTLPMMFATLLSAMVAGRLVWGAVRFILAGLTGSSFPFSAFLSGALLTAVPGILPNSF